MRWFLFSFLCCCCFILSQLVACRRKTMVRLRSILVSNARINSKTYRLRFESFSSCFSSVFYSFFCTSHSTLVVCITQFHALRSESFNCLQFEVMSESIGIDFQFVWWFLHTPISTSKWLSMLTNYLINVSVV